MNKVTKKAWIALAKKENWADLDLAMGDLKDWTKKHPRAVAPYLSCPRCIGAVLDVRLEKNKIFENYGEESFAERDAEFCRMCALDESHKVDPVEVPIPFMTLLAECERIIKKKLHLDWSSPLWNPWKKAVVLARRSLNK